MQSIDRRDLLRFGSAGALLGGMHSLLATRAMADLGGGATSGGKALIVYLDGAADGLTMVYPHGDPNYAPVRASLALTAGEGLDIGSSVVRLNPALGALQSMIQAGDAAFIQRVGRKSSTRSHFTERLWLQRAGSPFAEDGVFGRFVEQSHPPESVLPACSVDTRPSVMLEAQSRTLPMIAELESYDLSGVATGSAPSSTGPDPGSGLLGAYHAHPSFPAGFTRIHRDGLALLSSVEYVQDNLPATWPPAGLAYPDTTFGRHVRDAIWTLQQPGCQIACVRRTGFDTHSNQENRLNALMLELADTLAAIPDHASDIWSKLAILVITEFGRNKTNSNTSGVGTDHGRAWCAFALGGAVQGGVYNGDVGTWDDGGTSPLTVGNGYLKHRTDYRTLYADLLQNHLGLAPADLGLVIPGWPFAFDAQYPNQWNPLGLF